MNAKIPLKREGILDDGDYRLRIDDVELKKSQAGNDYLNVKYAVLINGAPYGGAIWDVISLTPQSRFVVESFLDSIGAPNSNDSVSPQWFKGKFCWAHLKTGEWKGKLRNEVDYYIVAPTGESQVDVDDEEDEDEEEEMQVKRPAKSATAPAAKAKKQRQEITEMEEEDFPV